MSIVCTKKKKSIAFSPPPNIYSLKTAPLQSLLLLRSAKPVSSTQLFSMNSHLLIYLYAVTPPFCSVVYSKHCELWVLWFLHQRTCLFSPHLSMCLSFLPSLDVPRQTQVFGSHGSWTRQYCLPPFSALLLLVWVFPRLVSFASEFVTLVSLFRAPTDFIDSLYLCCF